MGQHQVVRSGEPFGARRMAGRHLASDIAEVGHHVWLVQRGPRFDAVAQAIEYRLGVVGKRIRRVSREPAARFTKSLRQVPVIERRHWRDACTEQLVDQPVIEVEPGLVHRAGAGWHHSRP